MKEESFKFLPEMRMRIVKIVNNQLDDNNTLEYEEKYDVWSLSIYFV